MDTPRLIEQSADLLRSTPGIAAAWLFGSRARGDARPDSDVDVAILFAGADQTGQRPRLLAGLSAKLERLWTRPVDVVDIWPQSSIFRHAVLSKGVMLVDAEPAHRIAFESRSTSEYLDYLPTYQLATAHAVDGFLDWLASRRT